MCENIEKTQVVIPRLGQGENLLGAYALEVTGVTKGRGSLFIHTAGAVYMLKSFTGSMEKAQGLAQVLAELKAWDPAVEQILPTQEGAYAVREEGGPTYVLKSYQPGRECDVKNAFEVLEGARKLADLHLQLETIETDKKEVFLRRSICWWRKSDGITGNLRTCGIISARRKRRRDLKTCTSRHTGLFTDRGSKWKKRYFP